jgi:hypothetical protein
MRREHDGRTSQCHGWTRRKRWYAHEREWRQDANAWTTKPRTTDRTRSTYARWTTHAGTPSDERWRKSKGRKNER